MKTSIPFDSKYQIIPKENDVLIGRGHNVYNFIGNRRFRMLVDMFIQEYVECRSRGRKSSLVRHVIDVVQASGSRFLKQDVRGVFSELSFTETKMKVGHSLRDRALTLPRHLTLGLKTRSQLEEEGIALLDYVAQVTPVDRKWTRRPKVFDEGDDPPQQAQACVDDKEVVALEAMGGNHDTIGATCLLQLASGRSEFPGARRSEVRDISDPWTDAPKKDGKPLSSSGVEQTAEDTAAAVLVNGFSENGIVVHVNKSISKTGMQPKRYVRFLQDIVVPTLQEGHDALPVAGGWKFFPLPEFRNKKLDLGTQAKGWQLQLVPIAFQADSIMLDVPTSSLETDQLKGR